MVGFFTLRANKNVQGIKVYSDDNSFLLLLVSNRNQQRMYKDNYDQPY